MMHCGIIINMLFCVPWLTFLFLYSFQMFDRDSLLIPFTASTLSGCVIVACMTPFDVVSTRLYNQKVIGATSRG